jgi:hypothetical protein
LTVDDVQWVDELSLALCHYLTRAARESEQRVAVFVATRPGAVGMSVVDALPPDRVVVVELGPLARDEGMQLALAVDRISTASAPPGSGRRRRGCPSGSRHSHVRAREAATSLIF